MAAYGLGPEWQYDDIPEIIDGKNIVEWVDPDVMQRLEQLEEEEAELQAASEEIQAEEVRRLSVNLSLSCQELVLLQAALAECPEPCRSCLGLAETIFTEFEHSFRGAERLPVFALHVKTMVLEIEDEDATIPTFFADVGTVLCTTSVRKGEFVSSALCSLECGVRAATILNRRRDIEAQQRLIKPLTKAARSGVVQSLQEDRVGASSAD